jgi:hypothetical protein
MRLSAALLTALALAPSITRGQAISPFLFGENLWHADAPNTGANKVWGQMKDAGFKLIRIGGIMYNDKTPPVDQYVHWVDSIRSIGAEPLIQVSSIESAAMAANLVTELNVKRGYKIRFWAIGNEPTCGKEANASVIAGIAENIKARASAMKKVDPAIRIFMGDECYWRAEMYDALVGGANDVTGKDADGRNYVDIIAFHSYPFPGTDKNAVYTRQQVLESGIPGIRGMFQSCKTRTAAANLKQNRTGDAALACALTEFNVTYWNSSDNSPAGVGVRSFLNGQFFAEIFGSAMEMGVFTVAPWSMLEGDAIGGGSDLGLFDLKGTVIPRPSYHHIKLMARNMGGEFIPSSDNGALIKAYATRKPEEGAIIILNESLQDGARFTLKLKDAAPSQANPVVVKAGFGWEGEYVDSIPAQSTLLLTFHKSGQRTSRTLYTVGMAAKYEAPVVERFPVSIARGGPDGGVSGGSATGGGVWYRAGMNGGFEGGFDSEEAYEISMIGWDGKILGAAKGTGTRWRIAPAGTDPAACALRIRTGSGYRVVKAVLLGR